MVRAIKYFLMLSVSLSINMAVLIAGKQDGSLSKHQKKKDDEKDNKNSKGRNRKKCINQVQTSSLKEKTLQDPSTSLSRVATNDNLNSEEMLKNFLAEKRDKKSKSAGNSPERSDSNIFKENNNKDNNLIVSSFPQIKRNQSAITLTALSRSKSTPNVLMDLLTRGTPPNAEDTNDDINYSFKKEHSVENVKRNTLANLLINKKMLLVYSFAACALYFANCYLLEDDIPQE